MPMQADWVDAIFARLTLAYGTRFLSQFGALEPAHVKAHWANTLDGMTSGGVAHALKNLPADHPPNAMQFRALSRGTPVHLPPGLPSPRANDATVQRVVRAVEAMRAPREPRAWVALLQARKDAGEHLGRAQLDALRNATSFTTRNSQASVDAGSEGIETDPL